MSSDPRQRLVDLVAPALPNGWDQRPYTVRVVGKLAKPTMFVDYTGISHDGMPAGQVFDEYDLTFVSHFEDYIKAEEAIDPVARAVIRVLDGATEGSWSTVTVQQISHPATEE